MVEAHVNKGEIMEEKNELNDIILNKGGAANNNKKIVLAVATLGVILIIVVMLMNSLTSNGTDNLPQAVLPPEPKVKAIQDVTDEPLFEEVEVIEEEAPDNDNLDQIAKKLKQQSQAEITPEPIIQAVVAPKPVVKKVKKVVTKKPVAPVAKKTTSAKQHYVQVGSFSKYAPNKKFLKSITDKGYSYKYHKVVRNGKKLNKVLVGPFSSEKAARTALRTIRSSIEAGAFLTKI